MLQKFDERNNDLLIYVHDGLYSRKDAKVSVFDSVVQGGDAVWEGLRLYKEGLFCLDRHLTRLEESAKAMHFKNIPERNWIKEKLFETLIANNMDRDVHIRLTLTRGEKITSGMDPRLNSKGLTLIIVPEWKPPVYDNDHGIKIITSSIRRNSPMHVDSKIHHNNLINNILAKIQANVAGVDAALMLDAYGFASELNGTNIFMIKDDMIHTPSADACLHGITRGLIIEMAVDIKIQCRERNISLTELYNGDMVFCSGTMGELTPIVEIDGRKIKQKRNIFDQLLSSFENKKNLYCTPIP